MRNSLLVATIIAMLTATTAIAEPMTSADIQAKIIGQSFSAKRGVMRATMTYGSDGSVSLKTPLFTGGGTWRVAGNELCVNITKGPGKGESCVTMKDLGGGRYEASDGATLGPLK